MLNLKSILPLLTIALALSACGKSSTDPGSVVSYGVGSSTTTATNFNQACVNSGGAILGTAINGVSGICELNRATLGSFSGIFIELGINWVSTPLSVNVGDTITIADSSGLSYAVAGVVVSPVAIGNDLVFQAPASGLLQYGYGTGTVGFAGILVQTCFDQSNNIYACPQ